MITLTNNYSGKKFEISTKEIIGGKIYIFEGRQFMSLIDLGKALATKARRMKGTCAIGFSKDSEEELACKINHFFSYN